MGKFRAAAILVLLAGASSVAAHDFWIQPRAYWSSPRAVNPLALLVGHGPLRQRSPIPSSRIVRLAAVAPDGKSIDFRASLLKRQDGLEGRIQLETPGTYVLVLETDAAAQSHLPASRFNDYVKAEGLTPAIALRDRTHQTGADGSENYSRCAKSIIQVGPPGGSQTFVSRPIGLPLEIVPEQSPYASPQPTSLPVRIYYEGRLLPGALVKLTDLEHDEAPFETHETDAAGRAVFMMPKAGSWLLNVVWTKPLAADRETDFETVFSSLSFGFSRER